MNILALIDQLGPHGFVGFASFIGVVGALVYGALLLFAQHYDQYKLLDKQVKRGGLLGVLTVALIYLMGCAAVWVIIHLLARLGTSR